MPNKDELLRALQLGGIVAEHDNLLSECFVRHPVLTELTNDQKDLILGAKGAGKSALWKEIRDSKHKYETISNVELQLVTNPAGDPEFRDILVAIGNDEFPDVDELRVAWRLYLLAQFWRGARELINPDLRQQIGTEIDRYGIIPKKESGLKAAFAFAVAKARALKQLKVSWTSGVALEFDEDQLKAGGSAAAIPFNDMIAAINESLSTVDRRIWLILDRLDEIILGDEARENQVLKGLLLAYRDMSDFPCARLKVFLRDDVYQRVTSIGHFPALTHVRSKAAGPIRWELEDLLLLVVRRFVANKPIVEFLGLDADSKLTPELRRKIFYSLFPAKVDKGRAAETFKWIVDRITDGNGVATPRDLLSVIDAARIFQLEQMQREGRIFPEPSCLLRMRFVAQFEK
jgi:hypothetical protein